MNYETTKYNIVVCCFGKILVNVTVYVIPGYVYDGVLVRSKQDTHSILILYSHISLVPGRKIFATDFSRRNIVCVLQCDAHLRNVCPVYS